MPALVKTRAGAPVFTLSADDFTLTDNGVPQKLQLEEDTGAEPLALVVVVQNGGLGARKLASYARLSPLIDALVGNVPRQVALVSFDSEPRIRQGFTSDTGLIGGSIRDLDSGDSGAAILDSLTFAVDLLHDQPPQFRRAILLISETIDRDSAGRDQMPGAPNRLDNALKAISDTNTAIYSLAFSSSRAEMKREAPKIFGSISFGGGDPLFPADPGPPGGCMAKDPNADPTLKTNAGTKFYDCLSLLAPPLRVAKMAAMMARNSLESNVPEAAAQITGGEYFPFKDEKSLERDLVMLANHLPNRYVLSYHPQSPQIGLHAIGLSLKEYPDLKVEARKSYWADGVSTSPASKP